LARLGIVLVDGFALVMAAHRASRGATHLLQQHDIPNQHALDMGRDDVVGDETLKTVVVSEVVG
jgi:hypothetical protein